MNLMSLQDMNTTIRDNKKTNFARAFLLLLLLLAWGGMSGVWAAVGDEHAYTYHVVNDRGVVAVFGTIKQNSGSVPVLPDAMKSPLVDDEDYKFYLLDGTTVTQDWTQGRTSWTWSDINIWHYTGRNEADYAPVGKFTFSAEAVPMTALPDNDANIYVRYPKYISPKTVNGTTFDLSGNTLYNIQYGSKYLKYETNNLQSPTESQKKDKEYLWAFTGNDPYDIEIRCLSDLSKKLALNLSQTNSSHDSGNEKRQNFATDTDSENYPVRSFFLASGNTAGTFEITATDVSGIARPANNYAPRYLYFTTNNNGEESMFRSFWGDTQDANGINFVHGGDLLKATFTENTANVKYHLVNLGDNSLGTTNRKEILFATTTIRTIDIPSELSSPILNASDYSYYTADAFTSTSGSTAFQLKSTLPEGSVLTQGDAIPTSLLDIYVLYSYSASTHTVKLDGNKATFVKINNMYLRARDNITGNGGGGNDRTDLNAGISDVTLNSDEHYQWLLTGNDPYNMRLCSKFYGTDYYVVCKDGNTHIIKDGSVADDNIRIKSWAIMGSTAADLTNGQYELMGIKPDGTPYYSSTNLQYLAKSGSYPAYVTKSNAETVQTDLIQISPSVTYHVVNLGDNGAGLKNRKVAITALSTTGTVGIPDVIRSPFVNSYSYYLPDAFATTTGENAFQSPNNSYKLAENASLSNDVTDIYVLYDYIDGKEVNGQHIWLNGATNYKIKMGDTNGYITRRLTGDTRPDYNTTDSDDDNYLWTLNGQDPYNISIRSRYRRSGESEDSYLWAANKENNMFVSTNTTNAKIAKYMLLDHPTANYSLMAVYDNTQQPNSSGQYLFFGSRLDPVYPSIEYMLPTVSPQVTLIRPTVTTYTYHIVNKAGNVALSKAVGSTLATLEVPTELRTPYIPTLSNYKFFGSQADAAAYSASPTVANAAKAITDASEANADIYIGYNYDTADANIPSNIPVLDGTAWYQMMHYTGNNSNPLGYFYSDLNDNGRPENSGIRTSASQSAEGTLSDDKHLWKFTGDDPYAIYISNKYINEYKNDGKDWQIKQSDNITGDWYRQMAGYYQNGGLPLMMLNRTDQYYSLAIVSNSSELGTRNYLFFFGNNSNNHKDNWYMRNNDNNSYLYQSDRNGCKLSFNRVSLSDFTFHVFTRVSGKELTATEQRDYVSEAITLAKALERKYCNNTTPATFYTSYNPAINNYDDRFSGPVTTFKQLYDAGKSDIYVKYNVDDNLPFTFSNDGFENATWYRMLMSTNSYMYYNPSNSHVAQGVKSSNTTTYTKDYQFAVSGDPYEVTIWNRMAGSDKVAVAATSDATYVTIASPAGSDVTIWEMVDATGYPNSRFYFRAFGSASTTAKNWNRVSGMGDVQFQQTNFAPSELEALPNYTYTYNIVDNKGNIAIKYTLPEAEKQMVTKHLGSDYTYIPEAIRSPYLEGETVTFYSTKADAEAGTNAISETPSTDGANIYVRYTFTKNMQKELHLRGVRGFNMRVYDASDAANTHYVYDDNGTLKHKATPTEDEKKRRTFMWKFGRQDEGSGGPDPYAVQISNVESSRRIVYNTATGAITLDDSNETNTRFILMKRGGVTDNPEVELMAATGADLGTASPANYYSLGRHNGDVQALSSATYTHNSPQILIKLDKAQFDVKYYIIDKQNKIVVADIDNESTTKPALPDAWVSPLVKKYHYWNEDNLTIAADTYTLKTNSETEIGDITDGLGGRIYVTYTVKGEEDEGYIDLNGGVDYTERVARSSSSSTLVRNAQSWGKMYRLQFTSSADYYLEDGSDDVETTAKPSGTHLFPYTNGDGPMYIYDEARWDSQKDGAASTRTRWTWYLLSPDNDPYHVMVTSWQNSHAESNKNFYSFFHTYYNSDLGTVVTGNITDDDRHYNNTNGYEQLRPTEYMVLNGNGTYGDYKLLTTDAVEGSGQREVVKSFEQYWRNNPTALYKNARAIKGSALTAEEKNALKTGQSALATDNPNLTTNGWHNYKAYVNAAPWAGGSKSYEKDDHWFMTVSMGDGSFQLLETEMDAVLVLLDQHGWEIMRKTIYKRENQAAKYAASKAELKKWDSPMVGEYRYYTLGSKSAPGYHKYMVQESNYQKSTTSLGDDYPQSYQGGMIRDLYVTYVPKPEWADGYTGSTNTGTPYFIQQGVNYAKNGNTSVIATETKANVDVLTAGNELMWYLQRNAKIDTEMGVTYPLTEKDSSSEDVVYTEADRETRYNSEGKNGFDPYNLQIKSYDGTKYFHVDNISGAAPSTGLMQSTYSGAMTVSLVTDPQAATTTGDFYDNPPLRITGTTFMAIDDGNGNIRLMPRFDHSHVQTNFGSLATQDSPAQADDDEAASQTTLFKLAKAYEYIVIDNQGREAVRFKSTGDAVPAMKQKFTSPLAANFTFYQTATTEGGKITVSNPVISFTSSSLSLTDGKVYVRYDYDVTADTQGLLKGTWYTMQVNSTDVQYSGGIKSVSPKDATAANQQWRLMQSASDDPDPYAVSIYNHSVKSGTPEAMDAISVNSIDRFAVLDHPSTTTGDYAFLVAGSGDYNYAFLNGSDLVTGATTTVKSEYAADGALTISEQVVFTADILPSNVTYKIITTSGKVALQYTTTEATGKPVLPDFLKSPLMKDVADTYIYYAGATGSDAVGYTVNTATQTQTVKNLDDGIIYVRYDYSKSKTNVTDYYGTTQTLDLEGRLHYYIQNYDYWWVDRNAAGIWQNSWSNFSYILNNAQWKLTGNDPYEITITNTKSGIIAVATPEQNVNTRTDFMYAMPDEKLDTYPVRTFMLLKGGSTTKEKIILSPTGLDGYYVVRNADDGDMKIMRTTNTYTQHQAANPTYSAAISNSDTRIEFEPTVRYSVITNDGREALFTYSPPTNGSTKNPKVNIPARIVSPLLNTTDYTYYAERPTYDGSTLTTNENSLLAVGTKLSDISGKLDTEAKIYLRYTYDRENSPMKYKDGVNKTDEHGLDLDGKTWYTMAFNAGGGNEHNFIRTAYWDANSNKVLKTEMTIGSDGKVTLTGSSPYPQSLSDKRMLWRFEGNDPYAIRIRNGYTGASSYLAVQSSGNGNLTFVSDDDIEPYTTTYMLLTGAGHGDSYPSGGSLLVATTHLADSRFMSSNQHYNNTSYPIAMELFHNGTPPLELVLGLENRGNDYVHHGWVYFYKAPVARKYRYHAIKYEGATKKGETWSATLEHDWLMPVVLEDDICRLYTKYEKKTVPADNVNVTGTGDFDTRAALEAADNAQFYSDEALSKRLYVEDETTHERTYDVYPAIGTGEVCDIYFKYQAMTNAEIRGTYSEEAFKQQVLPFQWSTTTDIADDVTLYNKTDEQKTTIGLSGQDENIKSNWFFMVLDTDEGITATGTAGTSNRTFTGKQYFMRREDGGKVSWLNSNKTLHKNREDNYNNYSYNRLAESIRYNDHEPFREARWLWAFTGDPYDMKVINMESALGVLSDPGDSDYLEGQADCYTLAAPKTKTTTTNNVTTTTTTYPVTIPTSEPTGENAKYAKWGLAKGYGSEATFSLLSTAVTEQVDGEIVNRLRYWQMTSDSVTLQSRASQRENAIQLLPYEPCIYEDVRIIIRRDDEVKDYKEVKYTTPLVSSNDKENQLNYLSGNEVENKGQMKTGLSRMYFSAEDRMFVAGEDYIRGGVDGSTLPSDVRRKFCNYKIYSDDYRNIGNYTVVKGPYRGPQKKVNDIPQFDYDGKPIYQYYEWKTDLDGTPNYNEYDSSKPTEPQTVFVEYKVTSDMFLTEDVFDKFNTDDAKKAEVARMANENDHVYFIDFPLSESSMGYDYGAHAYFEQDLTFENLLPDKDLASGVRVWEKTYWNGTEEVPDHRNGDGVEYKYNDCEFRVTSWDSKTHKGSSRMESTPENLKWYFVGDPYNVQVFSTHPDRFGYNLCPFDETESAFRAVIDCVHLRQPDLTTSDNRLTVQPVDEDNNPVGDPVANPNYGRLFYGPFYWEMVDAASDVEGTFALRYRSTDKLLQQEGVYRYLVDGKSKVYPGFQGAFTVNIEYDKDNTLQGGTGKYADFHAANDEHAIIRLVQPAKVYVSSYKKGETTPKTTDELSEYYGVGETLTDMPRHLKRRYVKYSNWRYLVNDEPISNTGTSTDLPFSLSTTNKWKLEDCNNHPLGSSPNPPYDKVFVSGAKKNATFRLKVDYEVDDLVRKPGSEETVHLFTDPATIVNDDYSKSTWLDVQLWDHGGNYGWLFYDKTNDQKMVGGQTIDPDHTKVTAYTSGDGYTGWNTGLKGLHWAFVGDPYDFIVLNRRKYDDSETAKQWLDVNTLTTLTDQEKAAIGIDTSSDVNVLNLQDDTDQQHFGLIYYKMSPETNNGVNNGNNQYFLRTASLKTTVEDPSNGQAGNKTNDFQKVMLLRVPADRNTVPEGNFLLNDFSLSSKYDNVRTVDKANNLLTTDIHAVTIATANVEDEDQGFNDCFDANVYVYHTSSATPKAKKLEAEVRYTVKNADGTMKASVIDVMPFTLKRYGCDYTCYVNYDPATGIGTEVREFVKTSDGLMAAKDASGNVITITSKDDHGHPNIYYSYTYDDMSAIFTTPDDASHDDYTWANAYFDWTVTRQGNVVVEGSKKWGIIGYKYDIEGNVIGLEYGWVADSETTNTGSTTVHQQGWLNSHTSGNSAYADDNDQSDDNDQKWAFVGDPYNFQLKNYVEYLENDASVLTADGNVSKGNIQFALTNGAHWALALGAEVTAPDGTKQRECYLALVNDETGDILYYVTFDREGNNRILPSNEQYIYTKSGSGPAPYDPTGNRYYREGVKAFNITDLMKYAQYVIYHLVMAHQHSADYQDADLTAEQKTKVRRHLAEYIKHHDEDLGGKSNLQQYLVTEQGTFTYTRDDNSVGTDGTTYITDDFAPAYITAGKLNLSAISNSDDRAEIKTLLSKGSLRDLISYPVENFRVQRVAVGNKLTVPWYMRRQFCTYDLVQRDVLRSEYDTNDQAHVTDTSDPNYGKYIWQNEATKEAWYSSTKGDANAPAGFTPVYNSKWVSVSKQTESDGETPTEDAMQTQSDNGKTITQLKSYHNNRVVLVDVVYDVDPKQFRFSDKGRNTTAWYSMMTDNAQDGLMNFSYKDGIGARPDRTVHYTNNYLWAPEGDPYGFILHSRYATINGSGWDNIVVTTPGRLPQMGESVQDKIGTLADYTQAYIENETLTPADADAAIYTGRYDNDIQFSQRRIVHNKRSATVATWGPTNAVYEMYEGNYSNAFLMHPTAAYVNTTADKFSSFYMLHKPQTATTELKYSADVSDLRSNKDANWHLITTPEQLLPYFDRSGYVGGLQPNVANRQQNRNYYTRLQEFKTEWANNSRDLSQLPADYFTVTDQIRELVYGGKFYARMGDGSYKTTEYGYEEQRPSGADSYKLPLKFVSDNLVPMQQGYYRLEAFSRAALDHDAENVDGVGGKGIQGPRFISGYRFLSEKEKAGYSNGTLQDGSRWLHFFETDETNTTFNTFGELNSLINSLDAHNDHERDIQPHPALRGNIDILPAEYDASSIFYFEPSSDAFDRYTWGTQGLRVRGRSGGVQSGDKYGTEITVDATGYGRTKLVSGAATGKVAAASEPGETGSSTGYFDDRFRLQDIGGTAVTLRLLKNEPNGTNWDNIVGENLKHGSLCIDANHRYRITIHDNNEMMEIGDTYDAATNHWSGYGIQDTKWLLKPVGTKTQWPYNEMPFRVEVHKGEQKSGTDSNGNPLYNYYASLYVPFDSRLSNTTDAAFTLDTKPKTVGSTEGNDGKQNVTLRSLALLNNMGNPQFIPAEWPVIIRSSSPKEGKTKANPHNVSDQGTNRMYVDLYLPNNHPTSIPDGLSKIELKGSYLERSLTSGDGLTLTEVEAGHPIDESKTVMVFGQRFVEGTGEAPTTKGDACKAWYTHNENEPPGFYTNENWWRGHYYTDRQVTSDANNSLLETAFLAALHGDDTATKHQRSNTYVYHNRVFLIYAANTDQAPRYVRVFFGEGEDVNPNEDDRPIDEDVTERDTPWPCDVYDLSGRRVAENETPTTLLRNHPHLREGVYIFGHQKVVVHKR